MNDGIEIIGATPESFSPADRAQFCALVCEAGEVAAKGLPQKILEARALVAIRHNGLIRGVVALKRPQPRYRAKIAEQSAFPLPEDAYPYELGYLFVEPGLRGGGLAHRLIAEALGHADGKAVFTTIRAENRATCRLAARAGFVVAGQDYRGRNDQAIRLFVKEPSG